MTGLYNTPNVLHLIERDRDGNERTVRYYREDTINNFVHSVKVMLSEIGMKADKYDEVEE